MRNIKQSLGLRLVIIGILTLVLLIPALLIQNLIYERENRRDSVAHEISQKWGQEQVIIGPVISIPYTHYFTTEGKSEQTIRYAHFLPEELEMSGTIEPEIRYRGIYKAIVYNSELSVSGHFPSLDLQNLNIPAEDLMMEDAFVSVGISDMTGIKDFINISWDEDQFQANPGVISNDILASGISISPEIDPTAEHTFDFQLNLNGSSSLKFAPVGKETGVQLQAEWSNPSFIGNFLPVEREVNESDFSANWEVLHLNRNYPQQWQGPKPEVANSSFGVELLLGVDEYQKTMRTAKYAIMFISLTFLTFFMIELLARKQIHPVQYILIGFALLIFYTLLLSISEYLLFKFAYLIAAVAIIGLITVYSFRVLGDAWKTGIVSGILVLLYGYLYILLQLQDYALLMGSIGLFVVLAMVMYLTRHIDWFEVMNTEPANDNR